VVEGKITGAGQTSGGRGGAPPPPPLWRGVMAVTLAVPLLGARGHRATPLPGLRAPAGQRAAEEARPDPPRRAGRGWGGRRPAGKRNGALRCRGLPPCCEETAVLPLLPTPHLPRCVRSGPGGSGCGAPFPEGGGSRLREPGGGASPWKPPVLGFVLPHPVRVFMSVVNGLLPWRRQA